MKKVIVSIAIVVTCAVFAEQTNAVSKGKHIMRRPRVETGGTLLKNSRKTTSSFVTGRQGLSRMLSMRLQKPLNKKSFILCA